MKTQIHIFFNALSFFTRIPPPKWVVFSKEHNKKSIRYISLIGLLVGLVGALVYYGFGMLVPKSIAILLSIVSTIYITGAFHEDGFADVCDGFGGGWTKEKILAIMKDSQIGAYGAIGLILLLLIKFIALVELPSAILPLVIISGHAISRFMAAILVYILPYVSSSETSKSKTVAESKDMWSLFVNLGFVLIPLLFFETKWILLTLMPAFFGMLFLARKFKKWIGGQTGDCAGATQLFCEVIFYISVIVLWKFI
ncbi:MAG: adenosylcobinamide-GDP ribazoletransferase [Flavobacteriaceae bacterium]|nr:adenosylcobinamide-GDP ribazoletransferase [Flavobacteriaceae bacterium]